MNKSKGNTKTFIIDEACKLLLRKHITEVTMGEIAEEVGVGEATMYRYFGTKQNVIMAVATKLAKDVFLNYFKECNAKTGLDLIKNFYDTYLYIFKNHNNYFSFVRELDAFILTEAKDTSDYEGVIDEYKGNYMKAYSLGLMDHSIQEVEDIDTFYYASTHALLNLCKTLAYKSLLPQDKIISKEGEIQSLIDCYIYRLKA